MILFTGGVVPGLGGVHGPGGAWSWGCTWSGGGCAWSGVLVETPPPRRLLLRVVRILLECILVFL